MQRSRTEQEGRRDRLKAAVECSLESRVNTQRSAGDVLDLPWDVLIEACLVLGQHFQHGAQVEPPLVLRHPVPAQKNTIQKVILPIYMGFGHGTVPIR